MWNLIFDAYILEPNSLEFIVPSMASCTCWHYNVALRHVAVLYKQLWLLIWNTKKKFQIAPYIPQTPQITIIKLN